MAEREVGGVGYRIERLDAMKQFHVARRIAPVLPALVAALPSEPPPNPEAAAEGEAPKGLPAVTDEFFAALGPLTEAVAKMPDEDANFIISTCLGVCLRANKHGTGWSPVMAPNGRLMFQDIELPQMLQLTWAVIEENLGGFFAAMPSTSGAATGGSQAE